MDGTIIRRCQQRRHQYWQPDRPSPGDQHSPFSWNLPGNQLPYTYTMDDPSQLQNIVTSPTAGAGAGVLTWNKTNWLMTAYAATAPIISADPQSQTNTAGQSVTFTVGAGGSAPLSYQWYFNTNTPIANATNTFLTIASVQATNAGTYSVIVINPAGSVHQRLCASYRVVRRAVPAPIVGLYLQQRRDFQPHRQW